jgi:hypothetical protein
METATHQRFKSGEVCLEFGTYEFDGFADDIDASAPVSLDQRRIALGVGDIFPQIEDFPRACFWRLVGGVGITDCDPPSSR